MCIRDSGTFGFPTAWLDGLPGDRPDDAGREIAADDGVTRLAFTVPGRPQGKQRPRLGRGGRVYTPAATRRYESAVRSACLVAMMQAGLAKRYAGDCGLLVRCYFPDGRRRDGDNVLKSVQDALNGLLWIDDSHVTVATVPHQTCESSIQSSPWSASWTLLRTLSPSRRPPSGRYQRTSRPPSPPSRSARPARHTPPRHAPRRHPT